MRHLSNITYHSVLRVCTIAESLAQRVRRQYRVRRVHRDRRLERLLLTSFSVVIRFLALKVMQP